MTRLLLYLFLLLTVILLLVEGKQVLLLHHLIVLVLRHDSSIGGSGCTALLRLIQFAILAADVHLTCDLTSCRLLLPTSSGSSFPSDGESEISSLSASASAFDCD